MVISAQKPHPKRRWCQFSLKTLLLVMLLFTVTVGWIGARMRQARENQHRVAAVEDAVAAIEKLGGYFMSEYEEKRPQTWLERQFDDPGDDDDPVGVLKVSRLSFPNPRLTGPNPSESNSQFTDAGLEHLKVLTELEILEIPDTNVTDAGLEHLKGLTELQDLDLTGTKISDAGLVHLKGLTKLRLSR